MINIQTWQWIIFGIYLDNPFSSKYLADVINLWKQINVIPPYLILCKSISHFHRIIDFYDNHFSIKLIKSFEDNPHVLLSLLW